MDFFAMRRGMVKRSYGKRCLIECISLMKEEPLTEEFSGDKNQEYAPYCQKQEQGAYELQYRLTQNDSQMTDHVNM